MFSQDTVTGFLLAGTGQTDIKKNSNFLAVTTSMTPLPSPLALSKNRCRVPSPSVHVLDL